MTQKALQDSGFPIALTDAQATALGMKTYLHGTTYNSGIAPTVTSGESGFSVSRAAFVPYQMQDGSWRCKFNIQVAVSAATRTSITININGLTFSNAGEQAAYGWNRSATSSSQLCRGNQNSNALDLYHTSASTGSYVFGGDVELQSKPTWAY